MNDKSEASHETCRVIIYLTIITGRNGFALQWEVGTCEITNMHVIATHTFAHSHINQSIDVVCLLAVIYHTSAICRYTRICETTNT